MSSSGADLTNANLQAAAIGVGVAPGPVDSVKTKNSTLDDGSGNLETGGSVQAGGAGVKLTNNGAVNWLTAGGGSMWSGTGAPAAGLGAVGDLYLRTDTPGTALQRLYVKTAAAVWTGVV